MTDQTRPEQPPAPTDLERLRDTAQTLQTIVSRVREAVGTNEPSPVRESYRVRALETRVSDAEYERDLARQRVERAEAALVRVHHVAAAIHAGAPWTANHRETAARIRSAIAEPAPAATEATERETTTRVFAALHRSAEETVTRVIDLHESWVKAGPPPLGTPMSRWWDARLAELHDAICPPAGQPKEK
ncbi:hypothetical protein ACH49_13605 [Streptomyces leeuwenhoekii]|uniref:Uncharacterized protein n=1 Tax=Streptomyces leeuwenhoekii TaxID=1437453 RepID=A0ABR5HZ49_STRLW|nr:hypothetical protein [Streptomyces leeuwenhoekii]KMS79087.1 hypothetical protein ACH49_13605 [Streptomyces leeuwenhoekii]